MTRLSDAELRWAGDKHKQGYTWWEIGEALGVSRNIVMYQVMKSGYPYELPPLVMPEKVPDYREWAWESLLDGYSKIQIARAMKLDPYRITRLLQGRKKVMPKLVTRWIGRTEK